MESHKPEAESFRQVAEQILQIQPEKLSLFRQHWAESKFRHAYLVWHEFNQENKIELTEEQERVCEDFYWLYIN